MPSGFLKKTLKIVLISLIVVCVFDPADKFLGLKVPLFVAGWALFVLDILINRTNVYVSKSLLIYLTGFILLPLISIGYYFLIGSEYPNYDGFMYFKPYLFVTLTIILYASKIDLIKPTIAILTLLSVFTVLILFGSRFDIPLVASINQFGPRYGIVTMGARLYGTSIFPGLLGVYFHVSDMIVFPVAYFAMKMVSSKGIVRMSHGLGLVVNASAMFFSATRNNIVASLVLPVLVIFWYSKRKKLVLCLVTILLALCVSRMDGIKASMFSDDNESNQVKISFVKDYMKLLADKRVLLFGQGLGSYFNTTLRGPVSLTELTYFEFIRRFGLVLSLPAFMLFLYPLKAIMAKSYYPLHYLFIAYLFYLVMAFFNPFLMSSNGMILLSLVLYAVFLRIPRERANYVP